MNKELIAEVRSLVPSLLDGLKMVGVVNESQKEAVGLVSEMVLGVADALERLVEGNSNPSDADKQAVVDYVAAAAFASKFKQEL